MPTEPLGPHMLDFVSHSVNQTRRLGVRLGRLLQAGDVLLLCGEYGAGKTTFIQGVAEGLGVGGPVTSPSFALIWEYRTGEGHGQIPFYHVDLFRIQSPPEALALGLDDCFYSTAICAVEWADRIPEVAPEEYLRIHLSLLSETKRVVRMDPVGQRYVKLLGDFKQSAFG
jgi:tRNA threonylcarbamoyladenosine biosynthesis protein TsaE